MFQAFAIHNDKLFAPTPDENNSISSALSPQGLLSEPREPRPARAPLAQKASSNAQKDPAVAAFMMQASKENASANTNGKFLPALAPKKHVSFDEELAFSVVEADLPPTLMEESSSESVRRPPPPSPTTAAHGSSQFVDFIRSHPPWVRAIVSVVMCLPEVLPPLPPPRRIYALQYNNGRIAQSA